MKIRSMWSILTIVALFALIQGCNSNQGAANGNSIFSPPAATANSLDATTKVLASNVIVDPRFMNISASNLQSALDNIKPSTLNMIIGTWNTFSYSKDVYYGPRTGATGSITFKTDGTFVGNNGVNAFWPLWDLTGKTGKWGLEREVLIRLSLDDDRNGLYNTNVNPVLIISDTNKFVLVAGDQSVIFEKAR